MALRFVNRPQPWAVRRSGASAHVHVDTYISNAVGALLPSLSDEQLEALVVRWVTLALQRAAGSSVAREERIEADAWLPLVELSAVPRFRLNGPWNLERDLDRYAQCAQVVGDIAYSVLSQQPYESRWPVLELVPSRNIETVAQVEMGKVFQVPLPRGFTRLPATECMERVLADFVTAINLRSAAEQSSLARAADPIADAVRRVQYRVAFRSEPVGTPGGSGRCFVEYVADPTGSRWRLVIRSEAGERPSRWRPSGLSARMFYELPPGKGYGWLQDGTPFAQLGWPGGPVTRLEDREVGGGELLGREQGDAEQSSQGWQLVASAAIHEVAGSSPAEAWGVVMAELEASEIREFARWWCSRMVELYRADLWDAADILIGDCSDDVFEDFRAWLILQGESTYRLAVVDPDQALSRLTPADPEQIALAEGALNVIASAYEMSTGAPLPEVTPEVLHGERSTGPRESRRARFPRLAAVSPKAHDSIRFPWREA